MSEFEINDLVIVSSLDGIKLVTGVIHDDERLFVSDYFESGPEVEVPFSDVTDRWINAT